MSKHDIKIERNVPLPAPKSASYPWADMELGDSFTVPLEARRSAQVSGADWLRRHGSPWRCRSSIDDRDPTVARIWFEKETRPDKEIVVTRQWKELRKEKARLRREKVEQG